MTDPNRPGGPDLDNPRPWEQPGVARRDCAPHRGNVLLLLATVALVLGVASVCLLLVGWFAVPFALVVEGLARRDLEELAAGRMDPRGLAQARRAQAMARVALVLGTVGAVVCGPLLLAKALRLF